MNEQSFIQPNIYDDVRNLLLTLLDGKISQVVLEGMPWYLSPLPDRPAQDFTSGRFFTGTHIQELLFQSLTRSDVQVLNAHMIDDVHIPDENPWNESYLVTSVANAKNRLELFRVMHVRDNDIAYLETEFRRSNIDECSNMDASFQARKWLSSLNNCPVLNSIRFVVVHPLEFMNQQRLMLQNLPKAIRSIPQLSSVFPESKVGLREAICNAYNHVWLDSNGQITVTKTVFENGDYRFIPINL